MLLPPEPEPVSRWNIFVEEWWHSTRDSVIDGSYRINDEYQFIRTMIASPMKKSKAWIYLAFRIAGISLFIFLKAVFTLIPAVFDSFVGFVARSKRQQ
uniref:Uncharacterized protein n=1 Tax=Candidatus Kentrum sp. MB TaxID=2138164 RepID=A0A450XFL8_9GAMM|nr:MAG: hypothetical protein BECKMB1821G_GA0114241_10334 [Candidatus Kentron sp. MB]